MKRNESVLSTLATIQTEREQTHLAKISQASGQAYWLGGEKIVNKRWRWYRFINPNEIWIPIFVFIGTVVNPPIVRTKIAFS